ncbi:MAG: alpha/beta hydrolase [Mesorhizobium sp.]|uniref:alpha/beta hydrolase fold domain-containing protein n=1 Tax=Mesorhizobium sp. TaxID=1871066 RepID=UPI00122B4426|nr:alpha/beta hydrolase [Mesorhizobium sp.]TIM95605.1 MAG: alpha/beta hydrolase [Mesorhizobium sp.]
MTRGPYETRLDPALWAYIDAVNAWYPPEILGLPIDKQRAVYDRMSRAFHQGRPPGVKASDGLVTAAGRDIPVRRYRLAGKAAKAMVIYYHGGGFILGGLESHDDICAELCAGTGFDVLSVDYRLAPEHVHPAAFDDAVAAFEWAAATSGLPLVLCGESAGGNLAAGSYIEHAHAPLLSVADIAFYRDVRSAWRQSPDDPTFSPLRDTDFSGLPPTVIVTAQCDPLSSDGETYRDRIVAAGGKAWWHEEPRLVHSFLRARTSLPAAAAAFARIVGAVGALGRGEWPTVER